MIRLYDLVVLREPIVGYDNLTGRDVEMDPGTEIIVTEYVGSGIWKARLLDGDGLPLCFFHVHVDSLEMT